jgi:hypothetical protein
MILGRSTSRTERGASKMPVICELWPRHDATPEELKQLGEALEGWARCELGKGVLYSIDAKGVASLLSGEPPDPLALQVKAHHHEIPLNRIRQDLGALARDRSVRFAVKDGPHVTFLMVVKSLRQAIPVELVEDIRVGEISWME